MSSMSITSGAITDINKKILSEDISELVNDKENIQKLLKDFIGAPSSFTKYYRSEEAINNLITTNKRAFEDLKPILYASVNKDLYELKRIEKNFYFFLDLTRKALLKIKDRPQEEYKIEDKYLEKLVADPKELVDSLQNAQQIATPTKAVLGELKKSYTESFDNIESSIKKLIQQWVPYRYKYYELYQEKPLELSQFKGAVEEYEERIKRDKDAMDRMLLNLVQLLTEASIDKKVRDSVINLLNNATGLTFTSTNPTSGGALEGNSLVAYFDEIQLASPSGATSPLTLKFNENGRLEVTDDIKAVYEEAKKTYSSFPKLNILNKSKPTITSDPSSIAYSYLQDATNQVMDFLTKYSSPSVAGPVTKPTVTEAAIMKSVYDEMTKLQGLVASFLSGLALSTPPPPSSGTVVPPPKKNITSDISTIIEESLKRIQETHSTITSFIKGLKNPAAPPPAPAPAPAPPPPPPTVAILMAPPAAPISLDTIHKEVLKYLKGVSDGTETLLTKGIQEVAKAEAEAATLAAATAAKASAAAAATAAATAAAAPNPKTALEDALKTPLDVTTIKSTWTKYLESLLTKTEIAYDDIVALDLRETNINMNLTEDEKSDIKSKLDIINANITEDTDNDKKTKILITILKTSLDVTGINRPQTPPKSFDIEKIKDDIEDKKNDDTAIKTYYNRMFETDIISSPLPPEEVGVSSLIGSRRKSPSSIVIDDIVLTEKTTDEELTETKNNIINEIDAVKAYVGDTTNATALSTVNLGSDIYKRAIPDEKNRKRYTYTLGIGSSTPPATGRNIVYDENFYNYPLNIDRNDNIKYSNYLEQLKTELIQPEDTTEDIQHFYKRMNKFIVDLNTPGKDLATKFYNKANPRPTTGGSSLPSMVGGQQPMASQQKDDDVVTPVSKDVTLNAIKADVENARKLATKVSEVEDLIKELSNDWNTYTSTVPIKAFKDPRPPALLQELQNEISKEPVKIEEIPLNVITNAADSGTIDVSYLTKNIFSAGALANKKGVLFPNTDLPNIQSLFNVQILNDVAYSTDITAANTKNVYGVYNFPFVTKHSTTNNEAKAAEKQKLLDLQQKRETFGKRLANLMTILGELPEFKEQGAHETLKKRYNDYLKPLLAATTLQPYVDMEKVEGIASAVTDSLIPAVETIEIFALIRNYYGTPGAPPINLGGTDYPTLESLIDKLKRVNEKESEEIASKVQQPKLGNTRTRQYKDNLKENMEKVQKLLLYKEDPNNTLLQEIIEKPTSYLTDNILSNLFLDKEYLITKEKYFFKLNVRSLQEFINDLKKAYDGVEGYTPEDIKGINEYFQAAAGSKLKQTLTEKIDKITKDTESVLKKLTEYGKKYSEVNPSIKTEILYKLEPQNLEKGSEIDIVPTLNDAKRKMFLDIDANINNFRKQASSMQSTSPMVGGRKSRKQQRGGDLKEDREQINKTLDPVSSTDNTKSIFNKTTKVKELTNTFYRIMSKATDPTTALTLQGHDSLFNMLFNKYQDSKRDPEKGEYVASMELSEGLKSNQLLPRDVLKIDFRDKTIFVFASLFLRLISLSVIEYLIDKSKITRLNTAVLAFLGIYTGMFLLLLLIVNLDSYKLRIVFNYVNFHANSSIGIIYPALLWLFGGIVYYIMYNINGGNGNVATNDEDRLRLKYKIQVLSMITWIFLSLMVYIL